MRTKSKKQINPINIQVEQDTWAKLDALKNKNKERGTTFDNVISSLIKDSFELWLINNSIPGDLQEKLMLITKNKGLIPLDFMAICTINQLAHPEMDKLVNKYRLEGIKELIK